LNSIWSKEAGTKIGVTRCRVTGQHVTSTSPSFSRNTTDAAALMLLHYVLPQKQVSLAQFLPF
jgi:hypothetical protein